MLSDSDKQRGIETLFKKRKSAAGSGPGVSGIDIRRYSRLCATFPVVKTPKSLNKTLFSLAYCTIYKINFIQIFLVSQVVDCLDFLLPALLWLLGGGLEGEIEFRCLKCRNLPVCHVFSHQELVQTIVSCKVVNIANQMVSCHPSVPLASRGLVSCSLKVCAH